MPSPEGRPPLSPGLYLVHTETQDYPALLLHPEPDADGWLTVVFLSEGRVAPRWLRPYGGRRDFWHMPMRLSRWLRRRLG